ncbi:MAG TPA: M50 family metallopeptidase [Saprospiraceae bacterium]|nr:M50 family metallopeptidase [Saprospiraceae bacterium]
MEKQSKINKKSAIKRIAFGLVFGLTGLYVGYAIGLYLKSNALFSAIGPNGIGEKMLFIALTFFAIWLVIALHELGHLLAGLVQGFRLALYTAGFLGVRGTEHGAQVFFNRDLNLVGGLAATFPEHLVSGPALRRKFAWIVAAGPLTSLIVGIAGLVIGRMVWLQMDASAPLATKASLLFLFVTGIMSCLIFLATSLPLPTSGFMTDGARLLSLFDRGEKGLREEAGLSVMALMGAGRLPGEYPSDLISRVSALPADNLLGLNGHFIAFTHHFDRGDMERTLAFAQSVEANIRVVPAGPFRRYYLKEIAFFYAFLAADAEKARSIWVEMQKDAEKDKDAATCRVKAALALLEGQPDKAATWIEAGLKKVTNLPFRGQRRFEEKWLHAILEKITESKRVEIAA